MKRKTPKLDVVRLKAVLGPAATVAVLLALALAVLFGVPRLEAATTRALAAAPVKLVFDWPTDPRSEARTPAPWLTPELQADLGALVRRELLTNPDPFSAHGVRAAGEALARTGWFEGLPRVRRAPGGTIHISGTWRTPAAVVRYDGLDRLVASGAQLLPPAWLPGRAPYVVILGVTSKPVLADGRPVFGAEWGGRNAGKDVRAALALLAFIAGRPWTNQVTAIDVTDYESKHRLELVTTSGSRVIWGGAPSDTIPGEQSANVKLGRLDLLARQFGRIDAGRRLVEVQGPVTLIDESPAQP